MTPPATTPAGRRRAAKRSTGGHAAPRRVSGPVGGRAATATAGAAAATGRATFTPRPAIRPRTAPTRGRTAPRRGRAAPGRGRAASFAARAKGFVRTLPDHSLLDRAIRGRAWIPILGLMLAGIVAMQVEVLKLGASMGRSIDQGTALQSRNELLRASVAALADDQRIERMAAGMGMVMPAPAEVGFLAKGPGGAARAARSIHAPDAGTFLASLQALSASSTAQTPATTSTSTGTITPTGTSTGTITPTSTPAVTPSTGAPVAAVPLTASSSGGTSPTGG